MTPLASSSSFMFVFFKRKYRHIIIYQVKCQEDVNKHAYTVPPLRSQQLILTQLV